MDCVIRLQLHCLLYLTLMSLLSPPALVASTTLKMSLPGCPDKCGNMTIPYPFGILPGCYRDGFNVTCNYSTIPPKVILGQNIKVTNINITSAEARVHKKIWYRCYNQSDTIHKQRGGYINFAHGVFLISNRRNKFTAIGCDTLAYIAAPRNQSDSKHKPKSSYIAAPRNQSDSKHKPQSYFSGCVSFCESLTSTTSDGGLCDGLGCCQTSIPAGLYRYEIKWGFRHNSAWFFNPCNYAVLVEEDWYKFGRRDLINNDFLESNQNEVPFVIDWAIRDNGTCLDSDTEKRPYSACLSENSRCYNTTNGDGYICNCTKGYMGNPYLPYGCTDINECEQEQHPCKDGTCINKEGSYECACPKGTKGNGTTEHCIKIPEKFPYPARVAIACILGVAFFLGLCFLVAAHQQHKRHIKTKEEYQRYYRMMDNHLRVFSKKQIEAATNNFAETHVVGVGGQGNVYKGTGLLENNQSVAIKKAKELVEETQRGEFVNEILLLSQINHKNIVKLLGCCLEVKTPMLVYEFVHNGTLFQLLHGKSNTRLISLSSRLQVALDSAEALDYLHSSISRTILHGDVKSANILLAEKYGYRAKVSDFGASNLVPIDDTQVVKVVQGTRGYLDPEYVATAVLTKKSDVFSFGVVLLELITRKCAIFTDENNERKYLASWFVSNASKNKLHEMLDKDIVSNNEKVIEILQEVSKLAVRCLSVRGEDRPTMRQVMEKLQNVVRLHSSLLGPERVQEETESSLGESTSYMTSVSSALHSTDYITARDA